MVSLNLNPKPPGKAEDAAWRRACLDSIEVVLRRVLRSEARMWLYSTLASLEFGDSGREVWVDCFVDLLQDTMRESAKRLGKRRYGHPDRIRDFFDHFAGVGQTEHRLGARALANFAFRNRDQYWHRLVWHGTHAHSPATLAAKPHFFMELDVVNTVQNFLDCVPQFWESQEFRKSLKGGALWKTDIPFFADYLAESLAMKLDRYPHGAEETWATVQDVLRNIRFSTLCLHLLHLASDETLLNFVNALGSRFSVRTNDSHTREAAAKNNWMGVMVYAAVQWESLMEPTFCNACIENGRKISRILQEEEHEEDANTLRKLLNEISGDDEGKGHWALRDEVAKMDKPTACRYLALEAWVLYNQLSSESAGDDFYDALLDESGIAHKRICLSPKDRLSGKKRRKSSSKRSRKKKHKTREYEEDSDAKDSDGTVLPKEEQGWLLSIDQFKARWTKADLPEALTAIAVRAWLDWMSQKWL